MTNIKSLKGTRDFYPENMAVQRWLYQIMKEVSESFGYQEYDGPFLESIELYAAKSGEELVKEQSFVFPDRGGDLITLRPELTPTLARMISQRQQQLHYPLRWWSYGPFWRYERPQKGRTREFYQWNIDLLGVDTPEADAELAAVACSFMEKVGLSSSEASLQVNNRRLMDQELRAIGVSEKGKGSIFRLIDRLDKLPREDWEAMASEIGLDADQITSLQALLENGDLWKKSEELVRFFDAAQALGVRDFIQYNPAIIRGLDYYTGTVFEGVAETKNLRRAILGGGRYDNLLEDVGGDPLSGTGFAMGDVVIQILLEELGKIPSDVISKPSADLIVTTFDMEQIGVSYAVAAELRKAGFTVATYPDSSKMGKQFKYADRIGARIAIIIGPDEMQLDKVSIKNLVSRDQHTVDRNEMIFFVRKMLDTLSAS